MMGYGIDPLAILEMQPGYDEPIGKDCTMTGATEDIGKGLKSGREYDTEQRNKREELLSTPASEVQPPRSRGQNPALKLALNIGGAMALLESIQMPAIAGLVDEALALLRDCEPTLNKLLQKGVK